MSAPQQGSTAIMEGVRNFYADWWALMVAEGQPNPPLFDELDSETLNAWMLAFSSTVEVAARMAAAIQRTIS